MKEKALPKAEYDVWVRGYGLVDSAKVKATTSKLLKFQMRPDPLAK